MHRRPHTLAFPALLLPACAATDNNVGTVADGGGCPAPRFGAMKNPAATAKYSQSVDRPAVMPA